MITIVMLLINWLFDSRSKNKPICEPRETFQAPHPFRNRPAAVEWINTRTMDTFRHLAEYKVWLEEIGADAELIEMCRVRIYRDILKLRSY